MLESLAGLLLLVVPPHELGHLASMLTQDELAENPRDALVTLLLHTFQHLSAGTETFAALYLLGHGAIKLTLVATLLKEKLWGFPVALSAFGLFLVYQLYRFAHTRSGWLLAVSVLDVFVIVLTCLEYKRVRNLHPPR